MLRCLRPVTRMVLFTVLCVLIALPIACSAESAAAGQAVPVSGITLNIVSQAGTAGSTGVGQEETDWNSWAVGTP